MSWIFSLFTLGAEISTAGQVDLHRYLGKWYEIASIPQSFQKQCIGNTTAEYSLVEDGLIKVVNRCDTASGMVSVIEGRARVVDLKTNAKLKVTFVKLFDWIFAFGGDYWILDVAPDYSYALVGDPSLKYAWILGRAPALSTEDLQKAEAQFRSLGYDTCEILTSVQAGGVSKRVPLCEAVGKASF